MKHYILFAFLFLNYLSFSQIDAVKISSAKKAYENGDYQISIDALNEVSVVGQKNKMYLYYKGYSFYKLKQYDSAEYYLKKYLIVDMKRLEVAETLGDIDYERKKIAKQKLDKENCIKNCYKCYGTGKKKVDEDCLRCKGKGLYCYSCHLTNECIGCKGSGKNRYNNELNCSSCSGTGRCMDKHKCERCDGKGYEEFIRYCEHPNCK